MYERLERFAPTPVPVILVGETGTGKELAARAIHDGWGEKRPFVVVNCAAISKGVIESELFGHEQGAFTGAVRRHSGIVAQADGGILFLDEIGELPLAVQAKVLRVLESGEFRPVGGERTHYSRFRLLAATHRDLEQLVSRRQFRADLLHRLGAARIVLPPLRERLEDIPALATELLARFRAQNGGRGPSHLDNGAVELCRFTEWPGNVRQFRSVLEAAAAVATARILGGEQLREFLPPLATGVADLLPTLADALSRAEADTIQAALRRAGGDRAAAANLLGVSAATLYRRLRALRRVQSTGEQSDSRASTL